MKSLENSKFFSFEKKQVPNKNEIESLGFAVSSIGVTTALNSQNYPLIYLDNISKNFDEQLEKQARNYQKIMGNISWNSITCPKLYYS